MNSIKIYNVGFNWDNAVDKSGEPVFPKAPIAKSGSLNVNYPLFGHGIEISLMPLRAEGMTIEQIDGYKRIKEKRINRMVEQSHGKLSFVSIEDMPLSKSEVQELQDQISELKAQLVVKEETVAEEVVAEEAIPPAEPVQRSTRQTKRQARASRANKPKEEGE